MVFLSTLQQLFVKKGKARKYVKRNKTYFSHKQLTNTVWLSFNWLISTLRSWFYFFCFSLFIKTYKKIKKVTPRVTNHLYSCIVSVKYYHWCTCPHLRTEAAKQCIRDVSFFRYFLFRAIKMHDVTGACDSKCNLLQIWI